MTDSVYTPPTTGFYAMKPDPPGIWRILGILAGLANLFVWFLLGTLTTRSDIGGTEVTAAFSLGATIGYAVGGVLWPAFIALLFRIGKSFRNPRSTWKIFFFAALLFLIGGLSNLLVKGASAARHSLDAKNVAFLQQVADGAKAALPQMVDEETEFYDVTADPALLTYHYRLMSFAAEEVDPEALVEAIKPDATQKLCTTPETRDPLLKKGVTLRFAYYGNDGEPIASFDTAPAECGF